MFSVYVQCVCLARVSVCVCVCVCAVSVCVCAVVSNVPFLCILQCAASIYVVCRVWCEQYDAWCAVCGVWCVMYGCCVLLQCALCVVCINGELFF
jgi:hypothetical protein